MTAQPNLKYSTICSAQAPIDTAESCDPSIEAHSACGRSRVMSVWRFQGGRVEPVSVTIDHNGEPVTASSIRVLPLGEMLEEGRQTVSFMNEVLSTLSKEPGHESFSAFAGFGATGPQRGRTLTADVLTEVAGVYRAAYFAGEPVQAAVAEHFVISPSAATKRIMKARAAGLLDGIGRSAK